MRSTIFLDDHLGQRLQEAARLRGLSLSAYLSEAGLRMLEEKPPVANAFHLITRGGGGVLPGVNLDRVGELMVAEDQVAYGGDNK